MQTAGARENRPPSLRWVRGGHMPGSQPHSHLDDRVSRDSTPTRLKLALEMIYKWFRKAKRSPSQVPHQILAQGKWDHPGTPTGVAGDEKAEEAAKAGQFFPICKLSLCCPHPMRRLWEGRGAGWERRQASCAPPQGPAAAPPPWVGFCCPRDPSDRAEPSPGRGGCEEQRGCTGSRSWREPQPVPIFHDGASLLAQAQLRELVLSLCTKN